MLTLSLVGTPNLVPLTLPKVVVSVWCCVVVDGLVSMRDTVKQLLHNRENIIDRH